MPVRSRRQYGRNIDVCTFCFLPCFSCFLAWNNHVLKVRQPVFIFQESLIWIRSITLCSSRRVFQKKRAWVFRPFLMKTRKGPCSRFFFNNRNKIFLSTHKNRSALTLQHGMTQKWRGTNMNVEEFRNRILNFSIFNRCSPLFGLPLSQCVIRGRLDDITIVRNGRGHGIPINTYGRQTKQFFPRPGPTKARHILKLGRGAVSRLVNIISGHNDSGCNLSLQQPDLDPNLRFCHLASPWTLNYITALQTVLDWDFMEKTYSWINSRRLICSGQYKILLTSPNNIALNLTKGGRIA